MSEQPPSNNEGQPSGNPGPPATIDPGPLSNELRERNLNPPHNNQPRPDYGAQAARALKKAANAEWCMVLVASATLVVTAFQCSANRGQVEEAAKANAVAARAAKAAEDAVKLASDAAKGSDKQFGTESRPYVVLETMRFQPLKAGEKVRADLIYKNSGRTPAINFRVVTGFTVSVSRDFVPDLKDWTERSKVSNSVAVVGGGVAPPMGAESTFTLSEAQLKAIVDGDAFLFLSGACTYESVFDQGKYHVTTFNAFYDRREAADRLGVSAQYGNEIK